MASLAVIDGGAFPFVGFDGFVPTTRSATSWVFENVGIGRWITLTGTGFSLDADATFPSAGLITGFMLATTATAISQAERVFVLAELAIPAATLAASLPDAASLAATLLAGNDKIELIGVDLSVDLRNGPVTLAAGAGHDDIGGSLYADQLAGNAGNDVIDGRGGADTLMGDAGNDRLLGGDGDDSLDGGDGVDRLEGGAGADTLRGFYGNDKLLGGAGNDLLDPGLGRDHVDGGAGDDTLIMLDIREPGELLRGGAGWDVMRLDHLAILHEATEVSGFEELQLQHDSSIAIRAEQWSQFALVSAEAATTLVIRLYSPGSVDLSSADWLRVSLQALIGSNGDDRVVGMGFGSILEPWNTEDDDNIQLENGNDTAFGDTGNDTLIGGNGNDALYGEDDDDRLAGGAGADELAGGDGNDLSDGDGDDDILEGGAGADTLRGGSGQDTLFGDAGDDSIIGGTDGDVLDGSDEMSGGAGNDTLRGGAGGDLADGGDGADSVHGDFGHDTLRGGAGADSIDGGDGADSLLGDDGDDILRGGDGEDVLLGHFGADTLQGFADDDRLEGGAGDDVLNGGTGFNTLLGGAGNDTYQLYFGGTVVLEAVNEGIDTVYASLNHILLDNFEALVMLAGSGLGHGNERANTITGSDEANGVFGHGGNDVLTAGGGNDTLDGGAGLDRLTGGAGRDDLFGGAGADRFIFLSTSDSTSGQADQILDFDATAIAQSRDLIDLSRIDAISATRSNDAFTYLGTAATFSAAGQVRIVNGPGSAVVLVNTDTDQAAEMEIVVSIAAGSLDASDFLL